jgi:hypothetical protein
MATSWFANRGQILQLGVQVIAVSIAAFVAWPKIKEDELLSLGPILFLVLVGLLFISATRLTRAGSQEVPTKEVPIKEAR